MLNRPCRARSAVGRTSNPSGACKGRPLWLPATIRMRFRRGGFLGYGSAGRRLGRSGAELVAQHFRRHLFGRARQQVAELERAEGDADQPADRPAEMLADATDLAVLALAQAHGQPGILALLAIEA